MYFEDAAGCCYVSFLFEIFKAVREERNRR